MTHHVVALFVLSCLLGLGCKEASRPPDTAGSALPSAPLPAAIPEPPTAMPAASASVYAAPSGTPPTTVIPDDMAGVPGGTFTMGLDDQGEMDERPSHQVSVRPFLLDRTEVTNAAYYTCVDAGACRRHAAASAQANRLGDDRKFRSPRQPISGVAHEDAEAFCRFVSKRLPTEAEWERAARGSDGRMYPWGNDKPTPEKAVYQSGVTAEVGSRPAGAGPYGHLDLAGNVWEWVADRYDPYAYRRPTAADGIPGDCDAIVETLAELRRSKMDGFTGSNPIPEECEFVLRGGAFNYGPWGLRASNRVHHAGRFRLVMSGFRCARDWPGGPVDSPRDNAASDAAE